jgi:hypothetical protein
MGEGDGVAFIEPREQHAVPNSSAYRIHQDLPAVHARNGPSSTFTLLRGASYVT